MRISQSLTVNGIDGARTVQRTGNLTGETSEAGMLRVVWDGDAADPDYLGRRGWVAPGEYQDIDDDALAEAVLIGTAAMDSGDSMDEVARAMVEEMEAYGF